MVIILVIAHILMILFIHGLGKYPSPLLYSENPRKEYRETVVYTLLIILYLALNIFVLNRFNDTILIPLILSSILYLLIPLLYVRYRNHWTSKDLGFTFEVKSPWIIVEVY